MIFHDYKTMQECHPQEHARRMKPYQFYDSMLSVYAPKAKEWAAANRVKLANGDLHASRHIDFVMMYAVMDPAVCKCLSRTKLSFTMSQLGIDMSPTAICFAKGHEPAIDVGRVSSVMFGMRSGKDGGEDVAGRTMTRQLTLGIWVVSRQSFHCVSGYLCLHRMSDSLSQYC